MRNQARRARSEPVGTGSPLVVDADLDYFSSGLFEKGVDSTGRRGGGGAASPLCRSEVRARGDQNLKKVRDSGNPLPRYSQFVLGEAGDFVFEARGGLRLCTEEGGQTVSSTLL